MKKFLARSILAVLITLFVWEYSYCFYYCYLAKDNWMNSGPPIFSHFVGFVCTSLQTFAFVVLLFFLIKEYIFPWIVSAFYWVFENL